jgi:predicted CopG family antitoxin
VFWLAATTIRINTSLKNSLDSLKNFSGESYANVISRLINVAKEEALGDKELLMIESSLKDLKEGNVLSLKEAEKKWGI